MLICAFRSALARISLNLCFCVFALTFSAHVASAQGTDDAMSESTGSIEDLVDQGQDYLNEKHEGIAREYGGYRRSPNLFGINQSGGDRRPDLSLFSLEVGLNPMASERTGIYWCDANQKC